MNQVQTFIHQYFQNARLLQKELNEALKPHGLYGSQWSILFILQDKGPLSLTQIWRYMNVEAPTVTRTVNRLEALGFVEKVMGADRREKYIQLTPFAKEKVPEIHQSIKAFEQQFTERLSEQEIEVMQKLLEKMFE